MTRKSTNTAALATAAGVAGLAFGMQAAARFSRRISFKGKSVLVTGGSRGLGLVLARRFADERANVAICARDEDELRRAQDDLRQYGVDVLAVQCDLLSREQIEGMIEGLTRHFGSIDILVNNAGTIEVGPHEVMTIADYDEAMRLHFWAPLYTTMAVLPQMKQRQAGRIVNVSSIGGKVAAPHLLPYSASKFALVGFSEGLRSELESDGIYVTTVCPGLMRTGSPRNAFFKGQHRKEFAWFTISDSLPLISVSANTAARRILQACRYGKAEVMLSLPARVATTLHGIFPGITSEVNAWIARAMPEPGGIGSERAQGKESHSEAAPSKWTILTQKAAVANNEIP